MPSSHWLLHKFGSEDASYDTGQAEFVERRGSDDTIRKEPELPHEINPNIDQRSHNVLLKKHGVSSRN